MPWEVIPDKHNNVRPHDAMWRIRWSEPTNYDSEGDPVYFWCGHYHKQWLAESNCDEWNRIGKSPYEFMEYTSYMAQKQQTPTHVGIKHDRYFSPGNGSDPRTTVSWGFRDCVITESSGKEVFRQNSVEAPTAWSDTAVSVVASKYFRGHLNKPETRENSINQVITRVVDRIKLWGTRGGYFQDTSSADAFADDLYYLLVHQYGSFNSPVWFNLGVENTPQQASACFINHVDDSMESIMELAANEARLFKGGSGSGVNLSRLRSKGEPLSVGGKASGPVSFMRGWDSFAGAIKSGGTTRRAAKMVLLDHDHPDIMEFITCKAIEEQKAWALIDAGYDGGFNVENGAYDSIQFQNANHSVRVSDDFMVLTQQNGSYFTVRRTDTKKGIELSARDVLYAISQATHLCGDPGLQFDDTINKWHTCPITDRIWASNPCSEFVFLDDTACNLASLNLLNFLDHENKFNIGAFIKACEVFITAQEIIVGFADYPTDKIKQNSIDYRPLGLGYCNLGALLMVLGLPYDSKEGRSLAASITSLMTGAAYRRSAALAAILGPFNGYRQNAPDMLLVMEMHLKETLTLRTYKDLDEEIITNALNIWQTAVNLGKTHGFRNAQTTVLAPTGTIAFMMDADTTGIEPDIALIKYKKLVGGGTIRIVNQSVERALYSLGYDAQQISFIINTLDKTGDIGGAPDLKNMHVPVFDCAFSTKPGGRSISWRGHVEMMAAVQPFISGAISKTVNMPSDCTVDDIYDAYMTAWKLGIKAIAIYRDGSKRTQPLTTRKEDSSPEDSTGNEILAKALESPLDWPTILQNATYEDLDRLFGLLVDEDRIGHLLLEEYKSNHNKPIRRKLPPERHSITHKFSLGNHEGYLTVGLFEDDTPGELFIKMSKEGSTVSGLTDSLAITVSLCLQYGVPLETLIRKFKNTKFEPAGYTGGEKIKSATSVVDYIFRWLEDKFVTKRYVGIDFGSKDKTIIAAFEENMDGEVKLVDVQEVNSGIVCSECGDAMVRAGACYRCLNCGTTTGCG